MISLPVRRYFVFEYLDRLYYFSIWWVILLFFLCQLSGLASCHSLPSNTVCSARQEQNQQGFYLRMIASRAG